MKRVNDYLFTGYTELTEGVYLSHRDFFWTFLSAGPRKEEGICDWWYDVAVEYPNDTIIIHPVDTTKESMDIGPDTIYRGVWDLDEDPELLCYYLVVDTAHIRSVD